MTDSYIQVPPDSTGKKVDGTSIDVGADTVVRQRIVIGDNSASAQFATVTGGALVCTGTFNVSAMPLLQIGALPNINISATATIQGNVNISATANVVVGAGTAHIGEVSISGVIDVNFAGGISLASGTANIGFINHISATVSVVNVAGTANIGYINDISATIDVVIAQGTNMIGAISLGPGTANIGFINGVSATVNVAFAGGVSLAAGTANIGFINNISATVNTSAKISGFSDPSGDTRNVVDSSNLALRVNVVAGAAGGVSMNDNTSYTATSAFVPLGGVFNDAAVTVVDEDKAGAARITTNRALHVHNRTDGGANMDDSTNAALRVNVVAGAAGGVSLNDGGSYTATSAFVPIGGVFNDVATTTVGEDKAGAARITTNRAIHVNLRDNAGGEISSGNALSVKVERVSATASVVLAAGAANIGLINNISATVSVVVGAGTANIGAISIAAGTSNIGFIDSISKTVNVAFAGGISLAAGTANIGFINNISATVVVAGTVALGAGAANIGTINDISKTVSVINVAGTALMGAVSLAAGTANIGFINNISATVIVAGVISLGAGTNLIGAVSLGAGTANIGSLNHISRTVEVTVSTPFTVNNISATVTIATANPWIVAIPSASHGPALKQVSTSATAVFIVAPGAGFHIHITQLMVSNGGTVNTDAMVGWSGTVNVVMMHVAAAGGGFIMNFDPPWRVQSNEAVVCRIATNSVGNVYFNANYFVAA